MYRRLSYAWLMSLDRRRLSVDEILPRLTEMPGWTMDNDSLTKTFESLSYLDGVNFATRVAAIAERLDHHPDILIRYRNVTISVNTHDANGVTDFDFELARQIQLLD